MVVKDVTLTLELRSRVEQHFGEGSAVEGQGALSVSLVSFGFPSGLPREADLVFDARFLRNPHYDPILRPRTGLDPEVGAYVEADPDCGAFFGAITGLLALLLPRFVKEGKKYATIAIGCTGGRHRSVHLVERLAVQLRESGWRTNVMHRELARDARLAAGATVRSGPDRGGSGHNTNDGGAKPLSHRAQEA